MTDTLLIAILNALSIILAAVITSGGVIYAASKIANKRKLQQDLICAYKDLKVQYLIEKYHCEINITNNGINNKVHIRNLVRENESVTLSGRNTISQVERKIDNLERTVEK